VKLRAPGGISSGARQVSASLRSGMGLVSNSLGAAELPFLNHQSDSEFSTPYKAVYKILIYRNPMTLYFEELYSTNR
jgi:hypothetical protein